MPAPYMQGIPTNKKWLIKAQEFYHYQKKPKQLGRTFYDFVKNRGLSNKLHNLFTVNNFELPNDVQRSIISLDNQISDKKNQLEYRILPTLFSYGVFCTIHVYHFLMSMYQCLLSPSKSQLDTITQEGCLRLIFMTQPELLIRLMHYHVLERFINNHCDFSNLGTTLIDHIKKSNNNGGGT